VYEKERKDKGSGMLSSENGKYSSIFLEFNY
jgi:hypothetical protein